MRDETKYEAHDEPPLREVFRANARELKRLAIVVLITLLLEVVALIWLRPAHAQTVDLMQPSCYPYLSAISGEGKVIDFRLLMRADTDVAIWWCEIARGIEENYRTGNFGRPCEECFREDISLSEAWTMDRAAFRRRSTASELDQLAKAENLYSPRCVTATGATTKTTQVLTSADGAIGPALTDAAGKVVRYPAGPIGCSDWLRAGTKRYCTVAGRTDTAGRPITTGYVICKVQTAPAAGWPQ